MTRITEQYRGFTFSWQDPPLMGNMWQVHIAPDDQHSSALIKNQGGEIIDGRDYDEAKAKAHDFVDRLCGVTPGLR